MDKTKLNFISFVAGLLLLLSHNGILKIKWPDVPNKPDVVVPDETPDKPDVVVPEVVVPEVVVPEVPVVVVPDKPEPQPDNPVEPDTKYPAVPADLLEVSEPVFVLLKNCGNKDAVFAFAETYRVWSNTERNLADAIGNTNKFVTFNNEIVKAMKAENDIPKNFCPGIADALEAIWDKKLGEIPAKLTSENDKDIKDMFRAVSGQAYRAYLEMNKGG